MAGFSGINELISEITTGGKKQALPFYRVIQCGATAAAGQWRDCFQGLGTNGTGILSGTAGAGTALDSTSAGSLPLNTAVSPETRHLLSMWAAASVATAVPAVLVLTDFLYFYPSCVVTGTPTVFSNVASKPTRYGTGTNVQASCIVNGAIGAAQPILTVAYTEAGGTPPTGRSMSFASGVNSLGTGGLFTGSAAAGVYSAPWGAWAAGYSGIQQLDSYTLASGTTGTVSFVLHRPIAQIPLIAANVSAERDFVGQITSLPQINDAACLAFLILVGGALPANNVIMGGLEYGWS